MKKELSTLEKNVLIRLRQNNGVATVESLNAASPEIPPTLFGQFLRGFQKKLGGLKENGVKRWRLQFIDHPENEPLLPSTNVQLDTEVYMGVKLW